MPDIYFDPNYGKLYEDAEHGEAEIFVCQTENGKISNQFIKREIPSRIDGDTYYDIVTPYGYGGPIIEECNNKEELLHEYELQFSAYCEQNNIVSEFVRFHPIVNNSVDFKKIYSCEFNRLTVGTNLKAYADPMVEEFSKSCRQNIRKKLKMGMEYRVTESPEDFDSFKQCYYSTMERNNASDYYYFDDEYFKKIKRYFKNNTILVEAIYQGQTIAAGLYFISNKTIHIHLSGTLKEYLHLSPAYILRYGAMMWGKENGYELIHHGGGRSVSEEDNLYKFKKQFGKNTQFDFFIGKKIWNADIYNRICSNVGADISGSFFPAYREPRI